MPIKHPSGDSEWALGFMGLEFWGEAEDVNLGSIWVEMASKVTRNWKGAHGI